MRGVTAEQKAAFVIAQAVSAFAAIAGMQAKNAERASHGLAQAWPESCFSEVPALYGLEADTLSKFFEGE